MKQNFNVSTSPDQKFYISRQIILCFFSLFLTVSKPNFAWFHWPPMFLDAPIKWNDSKVNSTPIAGMIHQMKKKHIIHGFRSASKAAKIHFAVEFPSMLCCCTLPFRKPSMPATERSNMFLNQQFQMFPPFLQSCGYWFFPVPRAATLPKPWLVVAAHQPPPRPRWSSMGEYTKVKKCMCSW